MPLKCVKTTDHVLNIIGACMQQNKLFVGNLSFRATEDELYEVFGQHGDLEEVKIIMDRDTGRSRGFAFVSYIDPASAKEALALNGTAVGGRDMRVSIATERPRRPTGTHQHGSRF